MPPTPTCIDLHERVLAEGLPCPPPNPLAREPWSLAYWRRGLWLSFYEQCGAFRRELLEFYRDTYRPASRIFNDPDVLRSSGHPAGGEPDLYVIEHMWEDVPPAVDPDGWRYVPGARQYVTAVRTFSARWGLDRLYGEETAVSATAATDAAGRAAAFAAAEPNGSVEVHHWCQNEARWGGTLGEGNAFFALRRGTSGFVPQIGEERRYSVGVEGDTEFVFVDRSGPAPLRIEGFADAWHPANEDKKAARKRLLDRARDQVNRELDRIEQRALQAGYVFPDPRPQFARDLAWTFLKVARGYTYRRIADYHERLTRETREPTYIAKVVSESAPRVGVRLG